MKLNTYKASLNKMLNVNSFNLIYINGWSQLELDPDAFVNETFESIRNSCRGTNSWVENNIDLLKIRPSYFKVTYHCDDRGEGYYYNIIIDASSLEGKFGNYKSVLTAMVRSTGGFGSVFKLDNSKISAVISECTMDGSSTSCFVGQGEDDILALGHMIDNYLPDNAAISVDSVYDNNKKYNQGMSVKYDINVYDNLTEAFDSKTSKTIMIYAGASKMNAYIFKRLTTRDYNNYMYVLTYDNKIRMEVIDNKIVFYDGKAAMETIRPYIRLLHKDIRYIDIVQFASNKDLYYQNMRNTGARNEYKKIVLNFVNRKQISPVRGYDIQYDTYRISGAVNITYVDGKKRFAKTLELRTQSESSFYGQLVIPVDDKTVDSKLLDDIVIMLNQPLYRLNPGSYTEAAQRYKEALFRTEETHGDDVLAQWFSQCTSTSKSESQNVIKAYERMKYNLLNEYKTLQTYVNYYDFSKCTPIPKIKMDDKLEKNYYKSLQIEPKNIKINSINQKRIETIETIQPSVTVMVKYGELIINETYPLSKFIKGNSNIVELNYKELRGAVLNDKIKNRR